MDGAGPLCLCRVACDDDEVVIAPVVLFGVLGYLLYLYIVGASWPAS